MAGFTRDWLLQHKAKQEKLPVKSKYKNKPVVINGIKFQSTKEGARYGELLLLERNLIIHDLQRQVPFQIKVNGVKVCRYIADFTYMQDGKLQVEDVKSEHTKKLPVYRLKKKLMQAVHGIEIKEV